MIIAHNMLAVNAQRQFNIVEKNKKKSMEKLSSGYRINRAADDAAGLKISEKMRSQIRGLNRGIKNLQDGISLVQTADGALDNVHDMVNRMEELSIQAANATLTDEDRGHLQQEVDSIIDEINRVAKETMFNNIILFDDEEYYKELEVEDGSITKLISCSSADYGCLHEAYQKGSKYYSAAYLDFSSVTEKSIKKLDGGNFQFWCSDNCDEIFDIKFTTDGTPSSADKLTGKVHHYYSVDISGCKSGEEVTATIYNYVKDHLPTTSSLSASCNPGGVKVSHSNNLILSGSKLVVVSNMRELSSAQSAIDYYKPGVKSGKIACSEIFFEEKFDPKLKKDFEIQCSGNVPDSETISIYRMNGKILGVEPLDISSESAARSAIEKAKDAHDEISKQRSYLGASQNRLEYGVAVNGVTSENTSAAESRIRDADMAQEMVELSKHNILEQAGQAMMARANQSSQQVLTLLQ